MSLMNKLLFGILFPLVFCLAGGFFTKKGYVFFKQKRDKRRRCLSQTQGKIVNISSMKANRGRMYFPTYEYVVSQETIRVEIKYGTKCCPYKIGEQVPVWYDANEPAFSYVEGSQQDAVAAVGCLIMGSAAVLCGLFVGYMVLFG